MLSAWRQYVAEQAEAAHDRTAAAWMSCEEWLAARLIQKNSHDMEVDKSKQVVARVAVVGPGPGECTC
jgi:hypothetical protein